MVHKRTRCSSSATSFFIIKRIIRYCCWDGNKYSSSQFRRDSRWLNYFSKNKDISNKKLSKIIKGPDFPTGGELIQSDGIDELYETGRGSLTIRGVINTEEINLGKGKHKKNALIISELPYQISKAGWIEKLAELVNTNKINGISDIRDESDREGMRIVIELKKDFNTELVISNLYKNNSPNQFWCNILALIKGKLSN